MAGQPLVGEKHPQWRHRLAWYLHELQVRNNNGELHFSWDPSAEDSLNCFTFGSKVVELQTGYDIYGNMAELEHYDSPLSAYRVLRKLGYESIDQLIGSLFQQVPVVYGQFGDLLLIPAKPILLEEEPLHKIGAMDWAVAVCDPPVFWCISSEGGLARGDILKLAKANVGAKAFRVGAA